ncbi:GNAT family N-acetyltransferase [Clostridium sp. MSJ-4]|uniref:GNAT family N-acetyltransferase n=1 Tax=Clostridium simiarum TaxID=2841506 RepID=A0ABS6F2N5_9CLOT|nr:GNAT family N-acetyltransferase [Clostridium simiarum]MBU5592782.1 GNAT family N-acetyltransferase [Clostridium simiarum]
MYTELNKDEFIIVRDYFKEKYQIPAVSVINNNFPGKIFVDNKEEPKAILVWAISRWAYVYFQKENSKSRDFFNSLLQKEITPLMKDLNEEYFEVYSGNEEAWDAILNTDFEGFNIFNKHFENTFILNYEMFSKVKLNGNETKIFERKFPIVPEIYSKYFNISTMNKEVDGMVLEENERIVSQCVNNGFISDNYYFLDLDTFEKSERNKGYGSIVAYELINNLNKKGFMPLWETTEDNLPSQRVAKKLGFEKVDRYPVYIYKMI